MTTNDLRLGPPKITGFVFLTRVLAGVGGGVFGTLILLSALFFVSSYLTPIFESGEIPAFFVFIFVIMIFGASLCANLLGPLFIALTQREKYHKPTSALYQILILNLIVLFVSLPIYLIVSRIGLELMAFLAVLQVLLSAQASILILEIVSDPKYALLGVYSAVFSIFFSILLGILLYKVFGDNVTVLLLIVLPVVWGGIGFFSAIFSLIYSGLYNLYGVDFLANNTLYGRDVAFEDKDEEEVDEAEADEILTKERKEDEGRKFMEKKKQVSK